MEPTTLGYEKKTNPYLQLGKEEFIKKVSAEELVVPRYFKKMEELNLNGPPLLSELAYPKPLSLLEFEEEMQEQNMIVMDTRLPYAFAGSHIPNSLSMWLGGTSVYPGWLLDIKPVHRLCARTPGDIDTVAPRLRRLGFDNMCGYLCGGMNEWQEAGKAFQQLQNRDGDRNKREVGKRRRFYCWMFGIRLNGQKTATLKAQNSYFSLTCPKKPLNYPDISPLSLLARLGTVQASLRACWSALDLEDISNMLGGLTAWTKRDYPVKNW